MANWKLPSDEELDAQIEASRGSSGDEPAAKVARYDATTRRVVIDLDNGTTFLVPVDLLQGLEGSSEEELADIRILGAGSTIAWDRINVDAYIPSLLMGVFGNKRWMRELGRHGGSRTSEAKRAAARENGKKGGRPKKTAL